MNKSERVPDKMILNMVRIAMSVFIYEKGQTVIGCGVAEIPLTLEPMGEIHSMVRYFCDYPDTTYDDDISDSINENISFDIMNEYKSILAKYVSLVNENNGYQITPELAKRCFDALCSSAQKYRKILEKR